MGSILTTHVGSLPRSQAVVDFIFAREQGRPCDQAKFNSCMAAAVDEVVRRQVEAGIDVVSDGETAKISYATYVKDRYSGFSGDSPRNPPADLKRFPGYMQRLKDSGGTPRYARPMCTGSIEAVGMDELHRDIANLKAAMARHGAKEGFMNAASPGVVALFLQNDYYPDRQAYLDALAAALKEEYRAIVDAGLLLQVDCPDLALARHMLFAEQSDEQFVAVADGNVAVLNGALAGLPPERIRVHICWGNYEGPHVCDIGMEQMFATLMRVRADHVLFETSNPRHAHEWQVFAQRQEQIPPAKILVPGVLDSTTNFVEHPELVAQRLRHFADIVGAERVMAGTDCGFGTFAGYGAVDADIAYAKLAALAAGAKLV